MLVEILVSLIQHPLGASAPAPTSTTEDRGDHPLGLVPHQIRGYLSNFQNIMIKGNSYDCCSACSAKIIGAFKSEGWQFVRKALNEKGFVEDLSGLAEVKIMSLPNAQNHKTDAPQVQRSAEKALADMEWSDGGEDEEEGEGEII